MLRVGLIALAVRLRAGMSALLRARVRTLHQKIKHLRSPLRLILDTAGARHALPAPARYLYAAGAAPILLAAAAIIQCAALPNPLSVHRLNASSCARTRTGRNECERAPAAGFAPAPTLVQPCPWRLSQPPCAMQTLQPALTHAMRTPPPNSANE
ncbi:hypothetical protein B0H13DRAFT_2311754 [Mycena leptocephala]|nr:hypothetical protein B0H13DRAFT_2311754 [Mycena leptocephala]